MSKRSHPLLRWNYFTLHCITSLPCCLIEEHTHLKVKQGLEFCNSLLSIGAGEKGE